MKTLKLNLLVSLMLSTMLLIGNATMAQANRPGNCKGQMNSKMTTIPDLSSDQQSQIKTLRIKAQKEALSLRNELKEKRAHLQSLSTSDKANQKEIDNEIDKISEIQAKLMKIRAKLRQDIRNILTEEQRVYFDTHYSQIMRKHANGYRRANSKRVKNTPIQNN